VLNRHLKIGLNTLRIDDENARGCVLCLNLEARPQGQGSVTQGRSTCCHSCLCRSGRHAPSTQEWRLYCIRPAMEAAIGGI